MEIWKGGVVDTKNYWGTDIESVILKLFRRLVCDYLCFVRKESIADEFVHMKILMKNVGDKSDWIGHWESSRVVIKSVWFAWIYRVNCNLFVAELWNELSAIKANTIFW